MLVTLSDQKLSEAIAMPLQTFLDKENSPGNGTAIYAVLVLEMILFTGKQNYPALQ